MNKKYEEAMRIVDDALGHNLPVYGSELYNRLYEYAKKYNQSSEIIGDLTIAKGATKVVLIHSDWDFVIKISLDKPTKRKLNYCALEYANYKVIQQAGIGQICAAVERIGRIGPYTVYAQERVKIDEEAVSDSIVENRCKAWIDDPYYAPDNFDSMTEQEKAEYFYNEIPCSYSADWDDVSPLMFESWEADIADTLCEIVDELGINDIHCANVGYRADGRLVLVDFSGYNRNWFMREYGYDRFKI